MPDCPPDFVYDGGPCAELYCCYAIRCHVDHEQDKAYYWPTLARVYDVIEPLMTGWKSLWLDSDQALERRVGKLVGADGGFRTTLRRAAVGGLQKLTRERLENVATKFLPDNAHNIHRFENGGPHGIEFFPPKGPERVYFFRHEIFADRIRPKHARSVDFRFSVPHDLHLQVGGYAHQHRMSRADPINQAIELHLWAGLGAKNMLDDIARQIGVIANAAHIWQAESGYCGETFVDDEGYSRVTYLMTDTIEDASDGKNRFGSTWVDMLAED